MNTVPAPTGPYKWRITVAPFSLNPPALFAFPLMKLGAGDPADRLQGGRISRHHGDARGCVTSPHPHWPLSVNCQVFAPYEALHLHIHHADVTFFFFF